MYENPPYYLSVYGLAVKWGFQGTEKEWLASLKGEQGAPFTYGDFTQEQLEKLRGPEGKLGPPGEPGQEGKQGEQGKPFTYDDFTQEQLEKLRGPEGKPGPQGRQGPPGPAGGPKGDPFTYDDFTPEQLEGLRGPPGRDGASAYELAVQGGFTGREEEFNRWLAQAGNGSGGGTAGAGAVPEKIVEASIIGGGQAWVESDAPTGYYYQDIPVEECREWHRARVIISNILQMPYAEGLGLLPTVETMDGCIRVWGRHTIEARSIDISVELYSEGAGSGTGAGYTLPVASTDRLGGVKVGSGVDVEEDGTISVDAAGALGAAIATPDEVNAALDQAFEEKGGGEDGRQL